ncbi:MAG: putative bifunctional diguanylate cyclase/phosphodiesterase, partial [Candidatus Binatia bacterium]
LFQLRFEQALDRARKRGTSVSLLLIDLDDFKDVNDTLGHDAGDALLKKVAERLSAMTRDCDTVARLGGDEFALLVVDPLTLDHATSLARIVAETVKQPFVYKGRTFSTRASIGVAAFPDHDSDPRDLLKDADIALYRAKAKGRNRVESYSAQLRTIVEQRLALGEEVRAAIAKDQFVPFYQPKICLSTNRIVGFEALARWQHPSKGVLTPEHFGAVFDDHELGAAIGRQLLLKVTADMRGWLDVAFDIGRVAINLSSAQFNDPGLADEILDVLERRRITARSFEVEVTETVLLSKSADQVEVILKRFHDCGVQVALDDFGTGYASLTHLKRFPVDHIKIDQSFIMNLEKDAGDDAIVSAVVGLGTNLGMQITAEGVETQGQARRLRELGCHNAQGFLFSRPVGAPQVPHLLSRFSHKPSSRERSSAVRG